MEAIEHPPIFRLPGIPDHVTYTWLVMIILAAVAFVASRNLQLVPRGAQNFLEVVLEQFNQMIDDVMGHEGRRYLPLLATLGLFILTGNLMSLVPGLAGPTGNPKHARALRARVVLPLPLDRRAQAGASAVPQALRGARAASAQAPDVRDRGDQPPGPAALADASTCRQHGGGPYPAGRHLPADGPGRPARLGAVGQPGGHRRRRHRQPGGGRSSRPVSLPPV